MKLLLYSQCFFVVLGLTAWGMGLAPRAVIAAEKTALVSSGDVQVLTSGPIHEAFAEVVTVDPEPGIVAPKAPPVQIEEVPPKQKPEGDVEWISGYWAWDDERNDYIWVSGIWRVAPPGRQWVPGYWNPAPDGWQWISGYWASAEAQETEYLPEPPESVEIGPSSNAPSPDHTWIPGCWLWHSGRYAWRPGYWAIAHPDWLWTPAHYVWTPRGYIFAEGCWDYPVIRRGVLFAPIYFRPRVNPGLTFWFSPGYVIDLKIFEDALFVRPRYRHYYYGDYYDARHYRKGIYPWFSLHARRVVYDPIYSHQRWKHRKERGWENRLEKRFLDRRENETLRPPRSFDPRIGPEKPGRSSGPRKPNVVNRFDGSGKTDGSVYRFTPLKPNEQKELSNRVKEIRIYRKERQDREVSRRITPVKRVEKKPEPDKEKLSKSPIRDRSRIETGRKKAPPARVRPPKPNPNVEPLEKNSQQRGRGGDGKKGWYER